MVRESAAARTGAHLLSFGAFLLACPLVPWEGSLFVQMLAHVPWASAVMDGMATTAVAAAAAAVLWSLGRQMCRVPRWCALAGAILYGAASLGVEAVGLIGGANAVVATGLGAVLGFGTAVMTLSWCALLAGQGLRATLLRLGIVCAAASLCGLGLSTGLLPGPAMAYGICVLLGVASPVWEALHRGAAADSLRRDDADVDHVWNSVRTMIVNPCLGLFLFVFVMAARGFVFQGYQHIGPLSVLVAALLAVAVARWWPQFSLSTIYQVFLPAAAAVFLVLSFFPVGSAFFSVGFLVSHIAMAAIAVLALASLLAVTRGGEFSPMVVGGALCGVVGLALLLGLNLRYLIVAEDDLGSILLVCAAVYFVYVLVSPIADLRRQVREGDAAAGKEEGGRPHAPHSPACGESRREAALATLADGAGLSAREREILPYLARGHRPAYVADILCISEHTVRTHSRNMYRKLGVSSREELIQLVEGRTEKG